MGYMDRGTKTVTVRLKGGLGNQLFQYAAGRALAKRLSASLELDISGFAYDAKRRYDLLNYSIEATIATAEDLARFSRTPKRSRSVVDRLLSHVQPKPPPIYREPHFHFDPSLMTQRAPICLDGYWQSERYFGSIADDLRRELVPLKPADPQNIDMISRIEAAQAVSLHVRRGDYVSDPAVQQFHGTCSLDFYRTAVDYVRTRVDNPHLFIFSDDADWTRRNLIFDTPTSYVSINSPDHAFRDLHLMSRCRHHIIANSSFSWWGAWLNPSVHKIVVAPAKWFANSPHDASDLLPPSWVKL